MAALAFRTALAQIEQALHRVLRWKLQRLVTTVADVAALRGFDTAAGQSPTVFDAIFVTGLGRRVEWSKASTAADDGATVFRPSDVSVSASGRWLITESTETGGYAVGVFYWDGETTRDQFQARILAARPALAIVWEGCSSEPRSNVPGAIYDYSARFSIWCVDENLRPGFEVFFGSDYTADVDHPGVIAILGDVKKALADQNKRKADADDASSGPLSLGGGVKMLLLGDETMEDADLDRRYMILSLAVEVKASVDNPDSDDEHVDVDAVYVQPNRTALNQQGEFDPSNYIVSGYAFSPGSSLTATPTAGSAVVGGVAVSSTPAGHTFTAQRDTYVDLNPDGTLTYIEAVNDGAEPEATSGALRLGVVVTDALGIVEYDPIAAVSGPFGDAFQALPTLDVNN